MSATADRSGNSPVFKLPDTVGLSGALDMLLLAHVVLVRIVGSVAGVRPALGESIVVAGHVALDIFALPVRLMCFPVPSAGQERC